MGFESMPQSVEPVLESNGEAPEAGFEAKREAVMEEAKIGRGKLFENIMHSRLVNVGLNVVPGLDVGKRLFEAVKGETLSGEKLTGARRANYFLVAGAFAFTYSMFLAGQQEGALAALKVGVALAKVDYIPHLPHILEGAMNFAKEKAAEVAVMVEACKEFMASNEAATDTMLGYADSIFTPELAT